MPGSVDQVQDIRLPFMFMLHLDGVALDGDAPLPLQLHVVQHLVLEVPFLQGSGEHQEAVGQRAFAMVDMGDDTEVANMIHQDTPRFFSVQR